MDKEKAKELMKIAFLKELPKEMVQSGTIQSESDLRVDDKGEIFFGRNFWIQ